MKSPLTALAVLVVGWLPGPAAVDPGPKNLKHLIDRLESKYVVARLKAVRDLGNMGAAARDAVPALAKALHDVDEDVRKSASRALAKVGPAAMPILIEELKHSHFQFSKRAAFSLSLMGPEAAEAVPALMGCLKSSDTEVRAMATHALAEIGPAAAEAAPGLTGLLGDHSREVKKQAHAALARIGPHALPALRAALKSNDPAIRRAAADLLALRQAEAKSAATDLLPLLKDKQAAVRRSAARALSAIGKGGREVVEAVIPLAKDADAQVRAAAAAALAEISADAAVVLGTLVELFHDPVPIVRAEAGRAVAKFGPSAVQFLVNSVDDRNVLTRQTAIFALGEIGPEARSAVRPIIDQLRHKSPMIRASAAVALGKIGPSAAQDAINPLLGLIKRETESPVRVAVRLALVQLQPDDKEALAELSKEAVANTAAALRRPKTALEIQRLNKIQGVMNFYVFRNSFRFSDGLDTWSHQVLAGLGVEGIPVMVDTLNQENLAGGDKGFTFKGVPLYTQPSPAPFVTFFK